MRPYGEQHRCSGTRTSKPRRRWSVIRASVRRQVKKRARSAGALLAMALDGCASGAQTWPQVVDNHVLISAGVACFALMLIARILVAPWRALVISRSSTAAQAPDDDTARVVAANVKQAIDGVPPRFAHPPSHYIIPDPRSPGVKPKPPGVEYIREGFDPAERP